MACRQSFDDLRNNGKTQKTGCDCPGKNNGAGAVEYEPLTANWFRKNAGIITLVITVILLIKNS